MSSVPMHQSSKGKGWMAHQVDYDYCKGCGICFAECPRGVISLKEEDR